MGPAIFRPYAQGRPNYHEQPYQGTDVFRLHAYSRPKTHGPHAFVENAGSTYVYNTSSNLFAMNNNSQDRLQWRLMLDGRLCDESTVKGTPICLYSYRDRAGFWRFRTKLSSAPLQKNCLEAFDIICDVLTPPACMILLRGAHDHKGTQIVIECDTSGLKLFPANGTEIQLFELEPSKTAV